MRLRTARFFVLLLVVNGLIVGGTWGIGHAKPQLYGSSYVCLAYDGSSLINGNSLDLRTGMYHRDRRTHGTSSDVTTMPGDLSPDQRYRAYFSWNNSPNGTSSLIIASKTGEQRVIQDNVTSPFYFFWSPDSQQFAYTFATFNEITLSVANADGSHLRQVSVPASDPLDTFLRGWSPDSRDVLIGTRQADGRRWELWDATALTAKTLNTWDWIDRAEWSPDGRYFFYVASRNSTPNMTLNVVKVETFTQQGHILAGTANLMNVRWSPSSRYLRATYSNTSTPVTWHLDVFGIDGYEDRVLADGDVPEAIPIEQIGQWTAQTDELVYFRRVEGSQGRLTLSAFNPNTGVDRLIVADLAKGPFVSPQQPERVAIVEREAGQNRGVVMNLDGSQRTTIFQTEGDYGDAAWSEDGKYIAFTWSTGPFEQRDVHLSWAKQDGTGLHDIQGYSDLKDVVFAGDTAMLTIKAPASYEFGVQKLNLLTGGLDTVGQALPEVVYVDTEYSTGDYRVWWRDWSGIQGVNLYAVDATQGRSREFRFGLPQTASRTPPAFFVANGGTVAAVKFGTVNSHEYLQLSYADGSSPRVIAIDVAGLGDPLWSPDGKLVAFTQARYAYYPGQAFPYRHLTLEVYSADGNFVRSADGPSSYYGNLAWTTCD